MSKNNYIYGVIRKELVVLRRMILINSILVFFLIPTLKCQHVIIEDVYELLPTELLIQNKVKKIIHHNQNSTNRLNEILLRSDGQHSSVKTIRRKKRDSVITVTAFGYDSESKILNKVTIDENTKDTIQYHLYNYQNGYLSRQKSEWLNGNKIENYIYDPDYKLLRKDISINNDYSAKQEYDKLGRTIKYFRKNQDGELKLESSIEYHTDSVLIFQHYHNNTDTTIIDLNKDGFPLSSGSNKTTKKHRDQYFYYDNGLIKKIVYRGKILHDFKYEYWE